MRNIAQIIAALTFSAAASYILLSVADASLERQGIACKEGGC